MIPAHAFMLADVIRAVAAVCLYPLFVVVPGYVLAWAGDLFEFRRRTAAFQLALSLPLSISICPIAIYLIGRSVSMTAVWAVLAAVWVRFACLFWRRRARFAGLSQMGRPFTAAAAIWVVLALLSLVDLQFGKRVYYSVTALDFSVRTEFIHSITATGIPPANPFFYAGRTFPLRYHYFWLLVCSLVERAMGGWGGPRAAWTGGAIWCGLALMALVALYFREIWNHGATPFRRRAPAGIALLGVTGLDLIPNLALWVMRASGMERAIKASVDWWNEQIAGFTSTALWEAHYLCGLVCCLTAFLLLWEGARRSSPAARVLYGAIAGAALASAAGAAIYVGFVFAVFLALWTAICAGKRWWPEVMVLAVAGISAMVLFRPFLHDVSGPGTGGPPLALWVRPFSPVDAVFRGQGIGGWRLGLVNAAMLPLNYFLELGVFLAAAAVWWRARLRAGKPLARAELAMGLMAASSILICTFLRSSVIGNNDLGWRGFLIAQFALLLWTVDVLIEKRTAFLTALVALGLSGTVYDVLMLRFYPVMADAGIVAPAGWMAPDRQFGARTYAAREAYGWAQALPPDARLQVNPHVTLQDTYAFLYSRRPLVAGDEGCLSTFGGDPAACAGIVAKLRRFYPPPGRTAPPSLSDLCRDLPVNWLVAKDSDAVWADPRSWVWQERPLFANSYFRLFGCPAIMSH